MTDRPIIMSAESVLAILAGRKTTTRRVIKPQPDGWNPSQGASGNEWYWCIAGDQDFSERRLCPYGVPGDRLWVKETWGKSLHSEGYDENGYEVVRNCPAYKADGMYRCGKPAHPEIPWWSPIFMPRWASRLTLEVTGVRVERLQDITQDDAYCEGVQPIITAAEPSCLTPYRELWDKLNAKRGYPWASNPLVWVVEFRKAGEE